MAKNRNHPSGTGGPKTKAGKEASRRNALKHGLTARKLLPAALDKERVSEHRRRFEQQFRPANPTEAILVAEMARHGAMMELGEQAEGAVLRHGARELSQVILGSDSKSDDDDLERQDRVLSAAVSTDALDKFSRYRVAHERAFFAALDRLREMQAERQGNEKRVPGVTQPGSEPFASEQACEDYLASRFRRVDWRCPHCQHAQGSWLQRQKRWECGACHKQIGLRFGTVMERSQLPLQVWFQAIAQLRNSPRTSTAQLMEILNIARRGTVRAMIQRITDAMDASEANQLLAGMELPGDDPAT